MGEIVRKYFHDSEPVSLHPTRLAKLFGEEH